MEFFFRIVQLQFRLISNFFALEEGSFDIGVFLLLCFLGFTATFYGNFSYQNISQSFFFLLLFYSFVGLKNLHENPWFYHAYDENVQCPWAVRFTKLVTSGFVRVTTYICIKSQCYIYFFLDKKGDSGPIWFLPHVLSMGIKHSIMISSAFAANSATKCTLVQVFWNP